MIAQGGAVIVPVEQTSVLADRHDAVDEGIDAAVIDVRGYPEAVDSLFLKPFLHVVGGFGRWSDDDGVVVDDAVREYVADGPAFARDLQCVDRAGVGR